MIAQQGLGNLVLRAVMLFVFFCQAHTVDRVDFRKSCILRACLPHLTSFTRTYLPFLLPRLEDMAEDTPFSRSDHSDSSLLSPSASRR